MMKSNRALLRMMMYILGRNPDSYGLIPDENGFIRIRHLLHAFQEEEGFRYVREVDILNSVYHDDGKELFEIRNGWIRTVDRQHIPQICECQRPPKLLYTSVRRKGYGTVLVDGIKPTAFSYIWLISDREKAYQWGKRIDPKPVVIAVHTDLAVTSGVRFFMMGELFLSQYLPSTCLMGPPLDKVLVVKKEAVSREDSRQTPECAGGYRIMLGKFLEASGPKPASGQKKPIEWKHHRRQNRCKERKEGIR